MREGQHTLADWSPGQHPIDQPCGGVVHAARAAGGAEAAALAAEGGARTGQGDAQPGSRVTGLSSCRSPGYNEPMANEMLARLTDDMRHALKAGEKFRLGVLRMLINALKDEQHHKGQDELDADAELTILRRAVKTRRETVEQAKETGRTEIEERELAEIAIVEEYLPQMLTGDELLAKIREVVAEVDYSGPSDTGKFMKAWMARFKGLADGRAVQDALKSLA